jgi:hypothetical protein
MNGEVAREETSGLRVGIMSVLMAFPDKITELPKYEKAQYHVDITHGRPSGLSKEHKGNMFKPNDPQNV